MCMSSLPRHCQGGRNKRGALVEAGESSFASLRLLLAMAWHVTQCIVVLRDRRQAHLLDISPAATPGGESGSVDRPLAQGWQSGGGLTRCRAVTRLMMEITLWAGCSLFWLVFAVSTRVYVSTPNRSTVSYKRATHFLSSSTLGSALLEAIFCTLAVCTHTLCTSSSCSQPSCCSQPVSPHVSAASSPRKHVAICVLLDIEISGDAARRPLQETLSSRKSSSHISEL